MLLLLPPWGISNPHLGLTYVASALKEKKYQVEGYDLNIEIYNDLDNKTKDKWNHSSQRFWKKGLLKNHHLLIDKHINKLVKINFDILGMSGCDLSLDVLNYILPKLKKHKPKIKIIIGGGIVANKKIIQKIKKEYVDYIILDEGEYSILKVVESIKSKKLLKNSKTIKIDKQNKTLLVKSTKKTNLTKIPVPYFDIFPINSYVNNDLPISFSRGCIMRCAFCVDSPILSPFRTRKPQDVVNEMYNNYKKFNIRVYQVTDLLINGDIKFLNEFCDIIIEKKLHFFWGGQAIIRKEMALNLLRKMRIAGCTHLIFGVESFSDNIRSLMRKGSTTTLVKKVIKNSKVAGIETRINLVVGFPGETKEDLNETIKTIRELQPYIDYINCLNICNVFPDTPLDFESSKFRIINNKDKIGLFFKANTDIKERIKRFKKVYKVCKQQNLEPLLNNVEGLVDIDKL